MIDSGASDRVIRPILYKERLSTGSHTFFIELKRAMSGSIYVVIDQRSKRSGQYHSTKMRIFEDEMLEFQRVLGKMIHLAHHDSTHKTIAHDDEWMTASQPTPSVSSSQFLMLSGDRISPNENYGSPDKKSLNLYPNFYPKLLSTSRWDEFEEYTYYLIKLVGIQTAYKFLGEYQAGKADGFFKFGNFAVIYDCTLDPSNLEQKKQEQIQNYCHRLQSGRLELSDNAVEAFHHHHKHVWIITRNQTRTLQSFNDIVVKEVAVQDLMKIYQERLQYPMPSNQLELRLRTL